MIHLQESLNKGINIKDMLTDQRPREKMLTKGVKSLSDAELLAIIIRTGTKKYNAIELSTQIFKEKLINISHGMVVNDYVVSLVTFKDLSEDSIKDYINTNESLDKAGAYGIQGYGALLVDNIQGDYFNIVGLPISRLSDLLKNHFDINLFYGG